MLKVRPSGAKGGILPAAASSLTRSASCPHTARSVQGQRWRTCGGEAGGGGRAGRSTHELCGWRCACCAAGRPVQATQSPRSQAAEGAAAAHLDVGGEGGAGAAAGAKRPAFRHEKLAFDVVVGRHHGGRRAHAQPGRRRCRGGERRGGWCAAGKRVSAAGRWAAAGAAAAASSVTRRSQPCKAPPRSPSPLYMKMLVLWPNVMRYECGCSPSGIDPQSAGRQAGGGAVRSDDGTLSDARPGRAWPGRGAPRAAAKR